MSLSPGVALGLLLAPAALWAAPIAVSELTEPGLAFKRYLAEMPPIKRIVFEESPYLPGKRRPAGMVFADGALQPGGYFLRHLSNSPWSSKLFVSGLSSEYYWSYEWDTKEVGYAKRDGWPDGAINRKAWEWFGMSFTHELIQTAARLGIPCRHPPNLSWLSQTEFQFSSFWFDYVGRITRFDGNRPVQVVYEGKAPGTKVVIDYEYESDQDFPPRRFVRQIGSARVTNVIHRLEIGLDQNATQGYHLRDLLPEDAKVEEVQCVSNSVRYVVQADGTMIPYRYCTPPVDRPGPRATRHSIVLFSLACLSATALFLARRARGRFGSTKTAAPTSNEGEGSV